MSHTIHDPRPAVDQIKGITDPKQRAEALFDTVHGHIRTGIEEAKKAGSVSEAVKVFEDTANQYSIHRDHIIETLSS